MYKIKSINLKLSVIFGTLLTVISTGIGITAYVVSKDELLSSVNTAIMTMAEESAKVVEEGIRVQTNALEALAESEWMKSTEITTQDKLKLLEGEVKRSGHIRMGIADKQGNAVFGNGSSVSISDRDYYKKAISGQVTVSDPMISKDDKTLVITYSVPIKRNDEVIGVLIAVRDGNVLSDYTNNIHYGNSGTAFMVNSQGTTIANQNKSLVETMSNMIKGAGEDKGLRQLGDLVTLMTEGKHGTGAYRYLGIEKYMGYAPVEGLNWSLAITAPRSEVMDNIHDTMMIMAGVAIFFIIGSILLTVLIAGSISKPIKLVTEQLQMVSRGDFTQPVSEKLLKKSDETGVLANSLVVMQESVREILRNVTGASMNVSRSLGVINDDMKILNKSMEEISATSQELSAGAEEAAVAVEEMNTSATEIDKTAVSISVKAQEGADTIGEVSKISENMKNKAVISRNNALNIYHKNKDDLERAIEQSKAVDQIDELSRAILDITAQTNLLSLNAAIEAARAGESGKGFAVVAQEIRKLSESSKTAASRIQEVTQVIMDAVHELNISSGEILSFIDGHVLKDYDMLVGTSEDYTHNLSDMNDMVTDFSASSEELSAEIRNMVQTIENITLASNDEAQGAYHIAQETSMVASKSGEVVKLADKIKEMSDSLITEVSKFKI